MKGRSLDALLFEIIEERRWSELKALLREDPEQIAEEVLHHADHDRGQSALHEVCRCQPPLDVVEVLIEANISALREKGTFGYIPLHFAVSCGASADVVHALIDAYPPGTRMRDDFKQALPVHLATKSGASRDVLMEILTAHPEGIYLRDGDGKTPMDHADALSRDSNRDEVINALNYGPMLCKVSKAAQIRVVHENENRFRSMCDAHAQEIAQWEERCLQIMNKSERDQASLRQQLEHAVKRYDESSMQLNEKMGRLAELTRKMAATESLLDNERKIFNDKLCQQEKDMQASIDTEVNKCLSLSALMREKESEILDLTKKVEELKDANETLKKDFESQKEVVNMMVDEVEKMQELEAVADDRLQRIEKLESELEVQQQTEKSLTGRILELERAQLTLQTHEQQLIVERDSIRKYNASLEDKLEYADEMIDVYRKRNESVREWMKSMSISMDSWNAEENISRRYSANNRHNRNNSFGIKAKEGVEQSGEKALSQIGVEIEFGQEGIDPCDHSSNDDSLRDGVEGRCKKQDVQNSYPVRKFENLTAQELEEGEEEKKDTEQDDNDFNMD